MMFQTWEWYVDQGQDDWYGICKWCQLEDTKKNKKWYQDTFTMIYNWLSDKNKLIADKRLEQEWKIFKTILVNIALDKWRIKWHIW